MFGVIDIGGGSTELTFVKNKEIGQVVSIPIGSLNTYRKYVKNLIPTKNEEKKIKQCIVAELEKINVSKEDFKDVSVYGIGGSIRGAVKLNKDFFEMDDNNQKLERKNIKKMIDIFEEKPKIAVSEILEVGPDRIHTLSTGMIILKTIMKFYGCKTVELCKWGIREGYLVANLKKESSNECSRENNGQVINDKEKIEQQETELKSEDAIVKK